MTNFTSEDANLSSVAEASDLVRSIAGPDNASDKVRGAVRRVLRALNAKQCPDVKPFKYSRIRHIWYRTARRIDAHEMDRIREAARKAAIETVRRNTVAAYHTLLATDPDFHSHTLAALERALVGMGVEVGTLDIREG